MRRWQQIVERYRAAVEEYQGRAMAYEEQLAALTDRIQMLRDEGRDVTALVDQLTELKKPQQPVPPADYVVPPVDIREAFILNLPRGTYACGCAIATGARHGGLGEAARRVRSAPGPRPSATR